MNIHKLELNDIRGFGRNKPLLHAVYLLGTLGLAGVPGFNGYISKTMIHEGLVEWKDMSGSLVFTACEWIFLFAAGLTAAYMLKTYIVLFWQKNTDADVQERYDGMKSTYLDLKGRIALIASAVIIPLIGLLPNVAVKYICSISLPFMGFEYFHQIEYFSAENLTGGAISLGIGTLVYLLIVIVFMYSDKEGYVDRWPKKLDMEDGFYRPVLVRALSNVLVFAARMCEVGADMTAVAFKQFVLTDNHQDNGENGRLLAVAGKTQRFLRRFRPVTHPDPREVSDLSYGNYFTNSVSFGLIIGTFGIVAALIYAIAH